MSTNATKAIGPECHRDEEQHSRSSEARRWIAAVIATALVFVGVGYGVGPAGADEPSEDPTTTLATTTTTAATSTSVSTTTTTVPAPTTTRPAPTTTRPAPTTTKPAPPTTKKPSPPTTKPAPWNLGLPANSGSGRRIVYSVKQQRVWWVESNGVAVKTYRVSGKANTPKVGNYKVFSKSVNTTSVNGRARMKHMVRFAWGRGAAIGFHSIPVDGRGRPLQSEAELGQYRSAGCVRQANRDAAGLYMWAPVGTQVTVVK